MPKDLYAQVPVSQGLAAERTVLAAERTFLAYVRTGLGFLIAGVSGAHFVDDLLIDVLALAFVSASLVTMGYGAYRYRRSYAMTRAMLQMQRDKTQSGDKQA